MRLKEILKIMFVLFCAITTFQVIFISLLNILFDEQYTITMPEMLRIPFIALCGALPMLVFFRSEKKKPPSRAYLIAIRTIHLVLTAGIVFGLLSYFEWIDAVNGVFVIAFFAIIYVCIYVVLELRANKLAREINKLLGEIHDSDIETHRD